MRMKAVIVAAGRSSRLYPLTLETPKSLLPVVGDVSMIERSVSFLERFGIEETVVVLGFHGQKIKEVLRDRVRYIANPFFEKTNNLCSLWLALPHVKDSSFIYLHSDIVYHEKLLEQLINLPKKANIDLLVDYDSIDEEAMKVRVENEQFLESDKGIPLQQAAGEWIGMTRIDETAIRSLLPCMEDILLSQQYQSYDTAAFNQLAKRGEVTFNILSTGGLPWAEIDTQMDLVHARQLFGTK